jgi:hypothetical protein
MMKEQLDQFDLGAQMEKITFVTDRGANFNKAFNKHKVLYCVAHRLNNILKRCFYHTDKKKSKSTTESIVWSRKDIETEITPIKKKTMTTRAFCPSPEFESKSSGDVETVSHDGSS